MKCDRGGALDGNKWCTERCTLQSTRLRAPLLRSDSDPTRGFDYGSRCYCTYTVPGGVQAGDSKLYRTIVVDISMAPKRRVVVAAPRHRTMLGAGIQLNECKEKYNSSKALHSTHAAHRSDTQNMPHVHCKWQTGNRLSPSGRSVREAGLTMVFNNYITFSSSVNGSWRRTVLLRKQ